MSTTEATPAPDPAPLDLLQHSSSRDQLSPLPPPAVFARDRDLPPPPLPSSSSRPSPTARPHSFPARTHRRPHSPATDEHPAPIRAHSVINFGAGVPHSVRNGSSARARSLASDLGAYVPTSDDRGWIGTVPVVAAPAPAPPRALSVGARLQPTLDAAEAERARAALKAKMTGYALNIAIGMQVLLGALTTGLGAALTGKSTSVAISILGGAATLVASYLARARGSNEPEHSLLRVQALAHFIREAQAFMLDHGHEVGTRWDRELDGFRGAFEGMMGHPGRGVGGDDSANAMRPRMGAKSLMEGSTLDPHMSAA